MVSADPVEPPPEEPPYVQSPLRSADKVRQMDLESLGLSLSSSSQETPAEPAGAPRGDEFLEKYLREVRELLSDGFAGVIFTGPPGTSKSYYANKIAAILTNEDPERVRTLQFHPSYQYEDFVEGFVPREDGTGFDLIPKHFLEMCGVAEEHDGETCVIVIDELSRSDPGRVFGEALTYIEQEKRGIAFRLASRREVSVPPNLVFLATMNPLDRGVDEVDMTLERRLAKIAMDPNPDILEDILRANGIEPTLLKRVKRFFMWLNNNQNEHGHVGHAYFKAVKDEAGLRRLWKHQLRFYMEKAFRLNKSGLEEVREEWERIFIADASGAAGVATATKPSSPPAEESQSASSATGPIAVSGETELHPAPASPEEVPTPESTEQ